MESKLQKLLWAPNDQTVESELCSGRCTVFALTWPVAAGAVSTVISALMVLHARRPCLRGKHDFDINLREMQPKGCTVFEEMMTFEPS